MANKRKAELTIASLILMLLVIFIHSASECVNGLDKYGWPFVLVQSAHRLSSFAVQGFIFLSGLKLFLPSDRPFSYKRFYISRFKRVVVPYLLVYGIYYVGGALRQMYTPSVSHFIGEFFSGGLVGHLYFVVIICQFYLLMPLWRWLSRKNPVLVLSVSLLIMVVMKTAVPEITRQMGSEFLYSARLFWNYLFYFLAGMYAGCFYDGFRAMLKENKWGITVLWTITGVVTCVNIVIMARRIAWPSWSENWHVLYCMMAILLVLCLSERVAKWAETPLVQKMDTASYGVYLIHPIWIALVDMALGGVSSLSWRLLIRYPAVCLLSVFSMVLWQYVKSKAVGVRKKSL